MAIEVRCVCGTTATVSDEYAGRTGRCRSCNAPVTVGVAPEIKAAEPAPSPAPPVPDFTQPTLERLGRDPAQRPVARGADPIDERFQRDKFLLRQKHLSINEKYAVWDEKGTPIMFVERPAHLLRQIMALFGGLVAGGVVFTVLAFTFANLPDSLQGAYLLFGSLLAIVVIVAVYVRLEMKRHVSFYADGSKSTTLLRVMQDKKFELLNATFTVTDGAGNAIGSFRKNYLYDFFRKQWECRDHGGRLVFLAREDSMIKSLLRRFLGPVLGLLRLNFVFLDPQTRDTVGIFNRSFTIMDRYVLDMSMDRGRHIDRRLALAMGVMLDTGERR